MTDRRSLPPDLYTEDYFLHACEGYEEFSESQGQRLSRRLSAAFALAEVTPGMKVLDVGCGGGILTEALAKCGARATGIDLSGDSIEAARLHARQQGLQIEYRYENIEDTAARHTGEFDVITCMEMLEHVPEPGKVIAACARLLKPGGHAFFSTINRTLKAFLFVIIGGEYILRLLPRGTHTYNKLIRPVELKQWARESGLDFRRLSSLLYNPFTGRFKVAEVEDNNYFVHFVKS